MGIFPNAQGQLTHKSLVRCCWISNPFEILWLSSLPARIKKNQSKKNDRTRVVTRFSPIINPWELSIAMETKLLIWSGPMANSANSLPQWCSRWNLITICQLVSDIFIFESVDQRKHRRTLASVPSYKLTWSQLRWAKNYSSSLGDVLWSNCWWWATNNRHPTIIKTHENFKFTT